MKPNLVTGSLGFIGSHLFPAACSTGVDSLGMDLKDGQDIRDDSTWKLPFAVPETIFHLAAQASIPKSFEDPETSHSHNVLGTLKVLEYARKTGANVVFSSSSSIYGNPAQLPTTEECPTDPVSPYAAQKLMCEEYCKLYWKLGVKSCALRFFNVFGERQQEANGGDGLALGIFLGQYDAGKPFTVCGTGEQKRDWVYVKDVVDANLKAAEWLKTATQYEAFNIGSGTNYSVNEVLDMIDPKHPRVHLPPRPEPFIGLADITKARNVLGWSPRTSLSSWLKTL